MASAANKQSEYACKCLNIRLTQAESKSPPPDSPTNPEYASIHVGEEGIHVAHPQLTIRVKSRGTVIPGTSRCSRFTTLSCLICDLSVYRVHQVISVEVEGSDLPLLPSDSWAEQEIMKSPNGWVEIHRDCLCGAQISQAESSPEYSPIYGVVLPPAQPTPSETPKPHALPESAVSPAPAPSDPISYLKDLPPPFPPPPFTSSHVTFLHLVSFATKESDSIRATAEKDISAFVKAKEAEIQAQEARLKSSVQRLWEKHRQGLHKVVQQRPHPPALTRPTPLKQGDHRTSGQAYDTPVTTIRDFVPVSGVAPPPTRNAKPKISALSASLATNSHLHEAMNSRKTDNASISSQSPTSTLVPTTTKENEVGSVLALPRKIDDTINTAMSYRIFVLEDEMNRKRSQGALDEDATMGTVGPSQPSQADGNRTGSSDSNKERKKKQADESKESKSKRDKHVHFKVQPNAKETNEKSQKADDGDANGMIFDMEDGNGNVSDSPVPVLPLLEQPSIPHRSRRSKPPPMAGLPASFQALRPVSLPAPSHIRPARRIPNSDIAKNIMLALPRPGVPDGVRNTGQDNKEDTDQDTSEDTTDDSPRQTSESDSEDSEDPSTYDHYHAHSGYGIPGSLPINIVSLTRPREVLSLASYQPKTSASELQPAPPPVAQPKKNSPASFRKAAYAERDRARAVDPGVLDFVPEEDEDDGNEVDRKNVVPQSVESGERARKQALKILQARAELPEEGMWRSLAS